MTDILLSIKPQYAQAIYNGTKRFEYRRVLPKKLQVGDYVYLYETKPIQAITGHFVVKDVIDSKPVTPLWRHTGDFSGLTASEFFNYFGVDTDEDVAVFNSHTGNTIEVGKVMKYDKSFTWYGNTVYMLTTHGSTPFELNKISNNFFHLDNQPVIKPPQSFFYLSPPVLTRSTI